MEKPQKKGHPKQKQMNRRAFLGALGAAGAITGAQVAGLRPKTDAEIRKEEEEKVKKVTQSVAENKEMDVKEDGQEIQ